MQGVPTLVALYIALNRLSRLPYARRATTRAATNHKRPLEFVTNFREGLGDLPTNRSRIDGEMHKCNP